MKSLINTALLKEQLKRYWAIAVLAFIAYALSIILPIYQMDNANDAVSILAALFGMRHPTIIIASVLLPLITVLATFSYLFQAKATTAMHSFPVNKRQLMLTNVLAGFILMVVPLLILCVFLLNPFEWIAQTPFVDSDGSVYYRSAVYLPMDLYPNGLVSGTVINTLPIIVGFFLRTVLSFTFYYMIFLMAAMLVGNTVVYVLVSVVLPFIHMGLYLLCPLVATLYTYGYEAFNIDRVLTNLLMFTQPLALSTMFTYNDPSNFVAADANFTGMGAYIITYILIAAVLFGLSILCNHIRKQERAGDSFVFTPVRNVLIFLLSMLAMIAMGAFFAYQFESIFAMYIGFVIGFVIAFFIAQMIAEKTLNTLHKARELVWYGGIMLGMFIVVIVVTRFDLTGYTRYVPKTSDIEGVCLNPSYYYFNSSFPEELKDGYFVEDEEFISRTVAAHKEIVTNRVQLRKDYMQKIIGTYYYDGSYTRQYIMYKLKNGKIVTRSFEIPTSLADDIGISALIQTDDVVMSRYISFSKPEVIQEIQINYSKLVAEDDDYVNYGYEISIVEPDDIVSILSEIRKDLLISEHMDTSKQRESAEASGEPRPVAQGNIRHMSGNIILFDSSMSVDYFDLSSAENTCAWLKAHNYME